MKLHGGPFNGQSAVAYGAEIGGLIDVNHRSYRITSVEMVPGWRESVASAIYVPKKPAATARPNRRSAARADGRGRRDGGLRP